MQFYRFCDNGGREGREIEIGEKRSIEQYYLHCYSDLNWLNETTLVRKTELLAVCITVQCNQQNDYEIIHNSSVYQIKPITLFSLALENSIYFPQLSTQQIIFALFHYLTRPATCCLALLQLLYLQRDIFFTACIFLATFLLPFSSTNMFTKYFC